MPEPEHQDGEKEKSAHEPRHLAMPVAIAIAVAAAIVLVVGALWIGDHIGYAFVHESTDDAKVDADTIILTSKIDERVDQILVDVNQPVHRGQLLARLDDRDERSRLNEILANRSAAIAQAQQSRETLGLTETQVATEATQGEGNVESARAQLSSAAANYDAALAETQASNAGADQATAQLRSSFAALPGSRENVIKTAFDLARDSALLKTGDVPAAVIDEDRAQYESARSDYEQAKNAVETARANLVAAQRRFVSQQQQARGSRATIGAQRGSLVTARGRLAESVSPYRISAQRATLLSALEQIRSIDAQVRQARDQLSYTRIYSAVDGTVASKTLAVGQTVSPGSALFTIVPTGRSYVTANFKETQLDLMRDGEPVDIHIDAYPEYAFVGHIGAINPAAQNQFAAVPVQNASGNFIKVTQRVPVRIYFDRAGRPPYVLRPGMSVEASVRVR